MGLDCSHNAWHGAYSAFSRWREYVGKLSGIPLSLMEGFYDEPYQAAMEWVAPREGGPYCSNHLGPILFHWIENAHKWLPIKWSALKPDVLHVLLNHSDCDGEIAAEHCAPLADRLEEILAGMPEDVDLHGHIGSFREKTQQFIDGLRLAASRNEPVEFG